MNKPAHILIGSEPWCNWLGTEAGRKIAMKVEAANQGSGIAAHDVLCECNTTRKTRRIAQALRPHFKRGRVKVVRGPRPTGAAARADYEALQASRGGL